MTLSKRASQLAEQSGRWGSHAHSLHGPENGQPLVLRSDFRGCRCSVSSELKGKAAHIRCAASFLTFPHLFSKDSFGKVRKETAHLICAPFPLTSDETEQRQQIGRS